MPLFGTRPLASKRLSDATLPTSQNWRRGFGLPSSLCHHDPPPASLPSSSLAGLGRLYRPWTRMRGRQTGHALSGLQRLARTNRHAHTLPTCMPTTSCPFRYLETGCYDGMEPCNPNLNLICQHSISLAAAPCIRTSASLTGETVEKPCAMRVCPGDHPRRRAGRIRRPAFTRRERERRVMVKTCPWLGNPGARMAVWSDSRS